MFFWPEFSRIDASVKTHKYKKPQLEGKNPIDLHSVKAEPENRAQASIFGVNGS